jgi:chromosome segregation ATPase
MKSKAFENVSGGLKSLEEEFYADLSKHSNDIEKRFLQWTDSVETKLSRMGEEAATARRDLERGLLDEMRNRFPSQDQRIVSDLEHLKTGVDAFGEAIRGQMLASDESLASFKEQLDHGLEEAKKNAENSVRVEIGKHSLMVTEAIKLYQRDLDDAREGLTVKIRELDEIVEEARRKSRDLAAETDNRIASVRSSVEEAERYIRETAGKTKLIDKADEQAQLMERRIEDLKSEIARLDQRRAEIVQLENDFVKIKRHADDVNAKMTRFL